MNKKEAFYTTTHLTHLFETIFYGLDQETLDTLREVAETRHYGADTVLVRQGDVGETFYVVIDGQVRFTHHFENRQEDVLGICGPGQYFGEMALLDGTPRAATCTTITPTTVLEITANQFKKIAKSSPTIAFSLTTNILKNLRQNDGRAIESLVAKNEELANAYKELQSAQLALIKHETIRRELEIATEVQQSFLPAKLPQFEGYQFVAHLKLEQRSGGNFYDVIELDDEHVGILLGNIADKGVHASLFMAVTRTLFLMESKRFLSPTAVATAVNADMFEVSSRNDIFVMAFYGVLHRPSGKLTYISAGHERPLIFYPDRRTQSLEGVGRMIGMSEKIELKENTLYLKAGTRLLIFNSGVKNSVNEAGNHYGVERLEQLITKQGHTPAADLINVIIDDLDKWQKGASAKQEDMALLVVAGD